jgi:hypothetical protein
MSEILERIEKAEREAEAALALAEDPLGPRGIAREHILAGWRLLLNASEIGEGKLPHTTEAAATRLRALQPEDDPLRAAADLVRAIANARRDRGLAPRRTNRRLIALVGLGVTALAIATIIATNDDGRDGPWRASYFANPDLQGPPLQRREGDVEFYWHRRAPIDGAPADGFSARFETCLVVDAPIPEAAFQISSDDGARVLLDDVVIVDDWSPHGYRSRGAFVPIDAGVHRLVVEYFDRDREANLVLVASLDGDIPKPIPARVLDLPRDDGSCDAR